MLIENRDYLRIHQRSLLEKLIETETVERENQIIVEPSKKGIPTMKVSFDDNTQYIHSKYDPEREAEILINQIENIDEYNQVIFIGTGLGYHIKEFLKRCPEISLSIYEPDLEILNRFLSHQNIEKLSRGKMEKLITTMNEEELRAEIQNLHHTISTKTLVYTLPYYSKRYENEENIIMQELKEIIKGKHNNLVTSYSFQKRWTINSIKNFPKVLETPNILHDIDKDAFKGKPAIIVAAGPALNEEFENLKYIKENGLAYIFSVGSAINALIEHGIYPDAACTYDPTERNQSVFKKLKERNITNVPLIFGSSVGFETLEDYPASMLHMLTNQDTIAPNYIKNSEKVNVVLDAPSIAIVTFQLLNMLGCSQIVLVGQNLAYQDNRRFAKGINFDFVENEVTEQEKATFITVKDVYGKDIHTNEGFIKMRQQFELYINVFSELNIEVINTTKGGAHIEGTVFMPLSEVISVKWLETNIVNQNWSIAENNYDISYARKQIKTMAISKQLLEKALNGATKELRSISAEVSKNQTKELEGKFIRFDKEFNKIRSNTFYLTYIEPMVRVHNQKLSEESQAVRFEKDLLKKGQVIMHIFAGFLMDCQRHIHFLNPYLEELEDQIKKLEERIEK